MLAFLSLLVLLTSAVAAAPVHDQSLKPPWRAFQSSLDLAMDCAGTPAKQYDLVVNKMALIFPVSVDSAKAVW